MSKRLLLDAGNTRLKWAVVEGGLWREQGGAAYTDSPALAPLLEAGIDCYIASVAREQHENQISALLAPFAITPRWLTAEAHQLGVRRSYANPQQLGVDRWMGLLAARQRTQGPMYSIAPTAWGRGGQHLSRSPRQGVTMNLSLVIAPLISLIAGILILVVPRLLSYIVAVYLIVIGLLGLLGAGGFHLR